MMKQKKLSLPVKILLILGVVLIICVANFVVYLSRCSKADETAIAALKASDGVTTTISDSQLVFAPDGTKTDLHTGLIFYPGGKVEYMAYAPLMQKLAKRGVTCIVLKMPFDFAILDVDRADGVIKEYSEGMQVAGAVLSDAGVDTTADDSYSPIEHWYIGGHSLGGVAASMYLSDGHADEYEGLILLGSYPAKDLSSTSLRVLSIYGENDNVINMEKYEAAKNFLPSDFTEVIIPGGNHAQFGSYGEQDGDGKAAISADEQQENTAEIIADWIKK